MSNFSSVRSLAAALISAFLSPSSSNDKIALANASRSPFATRIPVLPSLTSSGLPPSRNATTGLAQAIDSRIALEHASLCVTFTDTSNTPRYGLMSGTNPGNITFSARSSCSASFFKPSRLFSPANSPPTITKTTSSLFLSIRAATWRKKSTFFLRLRLETSPTTFLSATSIWSALFSGNPGR